MSNDGTSRQPSETMDITLQSERFTVVVDRPEAKKFWKKASIGRWEADTFAFVRKHCAPDTTFVDIGSWIGPISLYASRFAGRVLSLEPDPVAQRDLQRNMQLNAKPDVSEVWNVGVDNTSGTLTLYAPTGLGQSVTSSLKAENAEAISVPTVTFDQIEQRVGASRKIVVKVDIEGHEYATLDSLIAFMRRHHAPLHLSVHPRSFYDTLRQAEFRPTAKIKTWRETKALVAKLRPYGRVSLSDSDTILTDWTLFQFIFLRTRVRNFSIEMTFL